MSLTLSHRGTSPSEILIKTALLNSLWLNSSISSTLPASQEPKLMVPSCTSRKISWPWKLPSKEEQATSFRFSTWIKSKSSQTSNSQKTLSSGDGLLMISSVLSLLHPSTMSALPNQTKRKSRFSKDQETWRQDKSLVMFSVLTENGVLCSQSRLLMEVKPSTDISNSILSKEVNNNSLKVMPVPLGKLYYTMILMPQISSALLREKQVRLSHSFISLKSQLLPKVPRNSKRTQKSSMIRLLLGISLLPSLLLKNTVYSTLSPNSDLFTSTKWPHASKSTKLVSPLNLSSLWLKT